MGRDGANKEKEKKIEENLSLLKKCRDNVKALFWNVAQIKNKEIQFCEFVKGFDIVRLTETCVEGRSVTSWIYVGKTEYDKKKKKK